MKSLLNEIKDQKKLTISFFKKYEDEINIKFPLIKNFKEKLFLIKNEIEIVPKCGCGDNLKFRNQTRGYYKTCGKEFCIKKTMYESKDNTMIEKYGVKHAQQNNDIKEKTKKTNFEKYGVLYPSQNIVIKEKIKKTNIEKYGVVMPLQNDKIKQKRIITNLKNFGVDNVSKNSLIKIKKNDTFLTNYGVDNPLKSKEIRKKISETIYKNIFQKINEKLISQEKEILSYDEKQMNIKCLSCGEQYYLSKSQFNVTLRSNINTCKICNPPTYGFSESEKEILEFCKNEFQYLEIIPNYNKLKYEIDVYFPELNFGIEYNGLYWHSEIHKDKNYHQDKLEYFEEKKINLLQVWEDDWYYKTDIIKNIIRSKINPKKIYGRKCITKDITSEVSKEFHNKHHLDGYSVSKIHIGLFYNDELISVCSFGKSRFNKDVEYELSRYTTKENYSIIGGFSKMLKYFENLHEPHSILSYKKLDLGYKNFYEQVGFIKEKRLQPNFYWVVNKIRVNRINYQKHKLKDILTNQTGVEYMIEKGYFRCFDCGSDVFIKINNKK